MKEHKSEIIKIALSATLLIVGIILNATVALPQSVIIMIFAIAFVASGFEILIEAIDGIFEGHIFGECFLMSIASLGAFMIGEFPEAVFVMVFFRVGELLEHIAVDRSRESIANLMDIRPDTATLLRDGSELTVDVNEIKPDDIIVVRAGEKIPLDGIVVEGVTVIDTSPITGEALPRDAQVGGQVISGCMNIGGPIKIRVTGEYATSTVAKILDLVEHAAEKKAKSERFIKKFAKIYTPVVVLLALAIAVIPSIITKQPSVWIYRALMLLVASCPCALVVSVPLTCFGGIGAASRIGVLIKGADTLEALSQIGTVVLDKTGTLTKGSFSVTEIKSPKFKNDDLLRLAASIECYSKHPIAKSICEAAGKSDIPVQNITELAGMGMSGVLNGKTILAGNEKLMFQNGIEFESEHSIGSHIYIAAAGEYLGCITVADSLKDDSVAAIKSFKEQKIRTVMLTGDTEASASHTANEVQIDEYRSELLPADKAEFLQSAIHDSDKKIAFIGDGINDAPALALADIGIAMGALGSDAAVEAADVVIMDDSLSRLPKAIKVSRRTNLLIAQNIIFSLGIKALVLILSIAGVTDMWTASLADVGVLVIAVLNSTRVLDIKKYK